MAKRKRALAALVVIVGGAWLAFGTGATREKVIRSVADLVGHTAAAGHPGDANWGDVAKKIGDFAAEERGLKDSVNRAEAAQPPPGQ